MFFDALTNLAIRLGLRPQRVTPTPAGLLMACDRSENAIIWMERVAWLLLGIQLILAILPAGPFAHILAAAAIMVSIIVIRSMHWANAAIRSSVMLHQALTQALEAQAITIEQQRETIAAQNRALGHPDYNPGPP